MSEEMRIATPAERLVLENANIAATLGIAPDVVARFRSALPVPVDARALVHIMLGCGFAPRLPEPTPASRGVLARHQVRWPWRKR